MTQSNLTPNMEFAKLAGEEEIKNTAKALEANGIKVFVVNNAEEAKEKLFEVIPAGSEVFTSTSVTLDSIGILPEIDKHYDSVRVKLSKMDQKTQGREMIKLGAVPEWTVGSVQAVTETGSVVIGSNTGSQLAGFAASAAHVVWVVGAQKIVKDLDEAMKRLWEYSLPLEDVRAQKTYGVHSNISKVLVVNREVMPGRTTMIIIRENLGY